MKDQGVNWLKQMHSENGRMSSKRIYGGLLIISAIIALFLRIDSDLAYAILYTGSGLIGFGTTVELARALKGDGHKATIQPPPGGDVNIEIDQG